MILQTCRHAGALGFVGNVVCTNAVFNLLFCEPLRGGIFVERGLKALTEAT
jgi:hypothetical protein